MSKLSKAGLDRAILRLFNTENPVIPRVAMTHGLYDYAWNMWAKSRAGRRELAKQKRTRKP